MKKFNDELDKRLKGFLSLNFLLAEKQGKITALKEALHNPECKEDFAIRKLADEEAKKELYVRCPAYVNNLFEAYPAYKYISRTFDIGECLNSDK